MGYEGVFVEVEADAVAAELAHDAVTMGFGMLLDRSAHVAQKLPGLDLLQPLQHGLAGNLDQLLPFLGYLADAEHAAGV